MNTAANTYQNFILVTNFDNSGDDALVHTRIITADQLQRALTIKNAHYKEVYEIPEDEIQYYCYEPVYFTEKLEQSVLNILRNND